MDLTNKTIWQVAAGDTNRNYADLCLKWDVVLNGPGHFGSWPDCIEKLRADKLSERKITDIKRFVEEMKDGDVVVLRIGTSKVYGVGLIVGEYEWSDIFGDVDGWPLQHIRRVRWLKDVKIESSKVFDTYSLKLGDTTQKLTKGEVFNWLLNIEVLEHDLTRPLADIASLFEAKKIDILGISEFLFDNGVASASISTLTNQIGELVRIAKWYRRTDKPSEHETVAYLVVPLLRALGWTPQKMAVEWNRVDVALFNKLPRLSENLNIVVEAKKMEDSCLSALSQALSYSENKQSCDRLIVTDGVRYGIFVIDSKGIPRLFAYLNLTRLHSYYSVYGCHGAEEALLAMTPEWNRQHLASYMLEA